MTYGGSHDHLKGLRESDFHVHFVYYLNEQQEKNVLKDLFLKKKKRSVLEREE